MNDVVEIVDKAGHWTWQTWFGAAILGLSVTIGISARYLVRKQEEVWGQWMKSQGEKDALFKEIIAGDREYNKTMVQVVERNTAALEGNTAILTKVASKIGVVAIIAMLITGCAINPDADPVIVRAEQVRAVAFDLMNHYVTFEYKHREQLWNRSPKFKHAADRIRVTAPATFKIYNAALSGYKRFKDSSRRQLLELEVSNLQEASANVSNLLTEASR